MDERTKELGSQLNSAAEEETEGNKTTGEEKIEDLEEEDEEETGDGGTEDKEEKEDAEDEPETKETEEEEEQAKDKKEDKTKTKEISKTDKQDRWHGKSREEVIKSFEDLEKQVEEQKTGKEDKPKEPEKSEGQAQAAKDELEIPGDEELAKMTPKGFAEWMIKTVGKMVEKTYDTRGKVKEAVSAEIREAQKEHPLLKTNQEYREMILALVDAAAQKGTVMPLKDACAKVDTMIGRVKGDDNKITDEDKARLKKAKAQVERGAGAPASTGEEKGAEQKRLENIFGTGRSKSPFGGLGV